METIPNSNVLQQAKNASLKTGQHLLADPLNKIAARQFFEMYFICFR
jgi:hypothetical protein